jgi:hypothetical protein
MNAEELLDRYTNGERNFARVDLSGVDLNTVSMKVLLFLETFWKFLAQTFLEIILAPKFCYF